MSVETEVHWAVRYTRKDGQGTSTTDYGADGATAQKDAQRGAPDWPYTIELLKRTVRYGPWRVTEP